MEKKQESSDIQIQEKDQNNNSNNQQPTQNGLPIHKETEVETLERNLQEGVHTLNEATRKHHFELNANRELLKDCFVDTHSYPAIVKELNQENFSITPEQLLRVFSHTPADEEKLSVVDSIADRIKFCTEQHVVQLLMTFKCPDHQLKALKRLQYCPPNPLTIDGRNAVVALFQTQEDQQRANICMNA